MLVNEARKKNNIAELIDAFYFYSSLAFLILHTVVGLQKAKLLYQTHITSALFSSFWNQVTECK